MFASTYSQPQANTEPATIVLVDSITNVSHNKTIAWIEITDKNTDPSLIVSTPSAVLDEADKLNINSLSSPSAHRGSGASCIRHQLSHTHRQWTSVDSTISVWSCIVHSLQLLHRPLPSCSPSTRSHGPTICLPPRIIDSLITLYWTNLVFQRWPL